MSFDYDNPGKVVMSPSKLAHVVLRTNNFEKMAQFYVTFLGGNIQFKNESLAFITYDDEHHRIALASIPPLAQKARMTNGLEHVAFTFPSLPALFLAYRQRLQHSIAPFWCINHGVTFSLYYADPDGNILETQVDLFDDPEDATRFMVEDPRYTENPIGVEFDPEVVVEQLKNGVDEAEITKFVPIGPRGVESIPEPPMFRK